MSEEDTLFDQISREIHTKQYDEPTWLRALDAAQGDQEAAFAHYMQLRLDGLRQEAGLGSTARLPQPPEEQAPVPEAEPAAQKILIDMNMDASTPGRPGDAAVFSRWMAKMVDFSLYYIAVSSIVVLLTYAFAAWLIPPDFVVDMRKLDALFQDKKSSGWNMLTGILSQMRSFVKLHEWLGYASLVAVGIGYLLMQMIDACALHFFGTSPGRLLMQIKLHRPAGTTLGTMLVRNLKCYACGLCFGLSVLPGITMAYQYIVVSRGRQTSWDRSTGCRVTYGSPSLPTWVVAGILIAVCWTLSHMISNALIVPRYAELLSKHVLASEEVLKELGTSLP